MSAAQKANVEKELYKCDFEVFGKVQGVFFRKFTEKQARELGIRGWCMNTPKGTVKGQLEGPQDKIQKMQNWLKTTGSPKSRIQNANFSEIIQVESPEFENFAIIR